MAPSFKVQVKPSALLPVFIIAGYALLSVILVCFLSYYTKPHYLLLITIACLLGWQAKHGYKQAKQQNQIDILITEKGDWLINEGVFRLVRGSLFFKNFFYLRLKTTSSSKKILILPDCINAYEQAALRRFMLTKIHQTKNV